jgi:3-oxoacyl-[acyl-carrier-protein] synthase II
MVKTKRDPNSVRIVITGLGTINPLGNNVAEYWENLAAGKSGVKILDKDMLKDFPVRIGAEVVLPDDLSAYFPKGEPARLARFIKLGHIAASQAFWDSGIERSMVENDPSRFGAIIGTGGAGNGAQYETYDRVWQRGLDAVESGDFVEAMPNTAAAYFAKEFNLQGPNFTVNSACASSNHAICLAAINIKMGMADIIFAGGAEADVNMPCFAGFNAIYALSRRNDDPQTASRPFDKDRDGFVLGEGSGILCLEEYEHAKARGAKIYAELKGCGFSCDAYDVAAPHPEGRGTSLAMKNALDDAKLDPSDVDLINAQGTSTKVGDKTESRAIRAAFGPAADGIYVHSTKSMTGHLVGAAGGIEAIAGILALERGIVHPSINVFKQDSEIAFEDRREYRSRKKDRSCHVQQLRFRRAEFFDHYEKALRRIPLFILQGGGGTERFRHSLFQDIFDVAERRTGFEVVPEVDRTAFTFPELAAVRAAPLFIQFLSRNFLKPSFQTVAKSSFMMLPS